MCSWGDVYAILASFFLDKRVNGDSAAGKRLRHLIARSEVSSRAPGLDGALKIARPGVEQKDSELRVSPPRRQNEFLFSPGHMSDRL